MYILLNYSFSLLCRFPSREHIQCICPSPRRWTEFSGHYEWGWCEYSYLRLLVNTCAFLLKLMGRRAYVWCPLDRYHWFTAVVVPISAYQQWTDPLVIPIPCQRLDFSAHKNGAFGGDSSLPPALRPLTFNWCKCILYQALEYKQIRQDPAFRSAPCGGWNGPGRNCFQSRKYI